MFPILTPTQIVRVAAHGSLRSVRMGEVLIEPGDRPVFFVVKTGQIEIVSVSRDGETLVVVHGQGSFTGEANMLLGRPAMMRTRVSEPGEVVELTREHLLALVQTDVEIGDILMRGFIYRRIELIAKGIGDVVLLGSVHCASTLRIKEFLTRNEHPFSYIDLDREADVEALLDRLHVASADVPVLMCRGDTVLRNPSNEAIARCLGFNVNIDRIHVRDVLIVGGGPAGLAAAVYGASEGLDVLARALTQAQKFGAQIMIAKDAVALACDHRPYGVRLDEETIVPGRTVILATGAEYRRPAIENLSRFQGAGVYYSATPMEAQLCAGEEVIVVGGGNSAGQAAVFLSRMASRVHLLVRADGLAATMSRYLVRRIEDSPAIVLRTCTEIVALDGANQLESVRWRNNRDATTDVHNIRHLFLMTGAVPNTAWLRGCVALDAKGFVKTGAGLTPEDLAVSRWTLSRPPYLFETSLPGVFAVGDVRSGSMKRVASAVGEGSAAIAVVHQLLAE